MQCIPTTPSPLWNVLRPAAIGAAWLALPLALLPAFWRREKMARNDASPTASSTLLALALIPAFWSSGAMAQQACTDQATDLIADETMVVGDVNVCDDGTTLTVTYETTYPWCLLETNLHVATSEEDIPQDEGGIPLPFQFDYGDDHDCDGMATFEIPLADIGDNVVSPGDTVVIAAHAEVRDRDGRDARDRPRRPSRTRDWRSGFDEDEEADAWGDGILFVEHGDWAMYFSYAICPSLLGGAPACGGVSVCRVFVTEFSMERAFLPQGGADRMCNERARRASLPGEYAAWLSDSFVSARDRLRHSPVPYVRTDGVRVADDWDDLTDGFLSAPIDHDAAGNPATFEDPFVWTGSLADGSWAGSAGSCELWSTSDQSRFGVSGHLRSSDSAWSARGSLPCDSFGRRYCIQQ